MKSSSSSSSSWRTAQYKQSFSVLAELRRKGPLMIGKTGLLETEETEDVSHRQSWFSRSFSFFFSLVKLSVYTCTRARTLPGLHGGNIWTEKTRRHSAFRRRTSDRSLSRYKNFYLNRGQGPVAQAQLGTNSDRSGYFLSTGPADTWKCLRQTFSGPFFTSISCSRPSQSTEKLLPAKLLPLALMVL